MSAETPTSPGSLADYAQAREQDPKDAIVQRNYFTELANHRHRLAERLGITLEELHFGPERDLGGLAISEASGE